MSGVRFMHKYTKNEYTNTNTQIHKYTNTNTKVTDNEEVLHMSSVRFPCTGKNNPFTIMSLTNLKFSNSIVCLLRFIGQQVPVGSETSFDSQSFHASANLTPQHSFGQFLSFAFSIKQYLFASFPWSVEANLNSVLNIRAAGFRFLWHGYITLWNKQAFIHFGTRRFC